MPTQKLNKELLKSLADQIDIRFRDLRLLKFVELIDYQVFEIYKISFPDKKLIELQEDFPGGSDPERLKMNKISFTMILINY